MKRFVFHIVITILVSMSISILRAQPPGLSVGEKVRIFLPPAGSEYIKGTVTQIDSLTMKIVNGKGEMAIPYESISELEVSQGMKRNTRKIALIGASLGMMAGSLIAASNPRTTSCRKIPVCILDACGTTRICVTKGISMVGGMVTGFLGGAIIGGLFGLVPFEQWESVPLDASVSMFPTGPHAPSVRPTITLRLSF